ncbi:hypothetical protein B0H66DRAFT_549755 [Apodospora peruviana]|uniref:Transmembrane protein n=1 Tax=Apodospora peruviana TaxID=516989 RepID=A0AAE0IIV7_9PEZI|nr:hypothetical protein B0H66DRAFT_549755 [Apodospora peruviana]
MVKSRSERRKVSWPASPPQLTIPVDWSARLVTRGLVVCCCFGFWGLLGQKNFFTVFEMWLLLGRKVDMQVENVSFMVLSGCKVSLFGCFVVCWYVISPCVFAVEDFKLFCHLSCCLDPAWRIYMDWTRRVCFLQQRMVIPSRKWCGLHDTFILLFINTLCVTIYPMRLWVVLVV